MNTDTPSHTQRVLVVEDDKGVNRGLQRKFAKLGFQTEGCFDGQEALDLMNQNVYDAVLLDLMMPIKSGFDVLSEREGTKNLTTPVYVLTSLEQEEKIQKARELGAKQVYNKTEMSPAGVVKEIAQELSPRSQS